MESQPPPQDVALLVDPDPRCAESVRSAVRDLALTIASVGSVTAAITRIEEETPRLVLSELVLPDGSGFALCRRLRESTVSADVPIVLISQWSSESDRILAFECGADDFLAKPFFERELGSRVRALLRRSRTPSSPAFVAPTCDAPNPLEIDEDRLEVRFEGSRVPLTPLEFSLIAALARHRGRVLTRSDLIAEAWNPGEYPTERSVDAHVKSLRRKLGPAKDVIETVRGLGYRYSERGLVLRPRTLGKAGLG